jgi:hypothetical protein
MVELTATAAGFIFEVFKRYLLDEIDSEADAEPVWESGDNWVNVDALELMQPLGVVPMAQM